MRNGLPYFGVNATGWIDSNVLNLLVKDHGIVPENLNDIEKLMPGHGQHVILRLLSDWAEVKNMNELVK